MRIIDRIKLALGNMIYRIKYRDDDDDVWDNMWDDDLEYDEEG